jgi:phage baseplate assembly protein V
MDNIIQRLSIAIKNTVTRGKLLATSTQTPYRPLLNISTWQGTNYKDIELMQPYGMSSNPLAGGDTPVLQVGGTRDHLLVLHVDDVSLRIPDLEPGEFGNRDQNQQQIVLRQDRIEITQPKSGNKVIITSNGDINVTAQTGDMNYSVESGKFVLNASGDIDATSSGGTINMTAANIVLNGTVQVNGTVTATGEGTFNGGHTVSQHVHPGVQTGDGTTETPEG